MLAALGNTQASLQGAIPSSSLSATSLSATASSSSSTLCQTDKMHSTNNDLLGKCDTLLLTPENEAGKTLWKLLSPNILLKKVLHHLIFTTF